MTKRTATYGDRNNDVGEGEGDGADNETRSRHSLSMEIDNKHNKMFKTYTLAAR